MAGNKITLLLTVQIGETLMQVKDVRPLQLSGDRRRWRRQIIEYVSEQAETVARRYEPPPMDTSGKTTVEKAAAAQDKRMAESRAARTVKIEAPAKKRRRAS